LFVDPKGAAW